MVDIVLPLDKDQIDDLRAEAEEEGDKIDPNSIYFVNKVVGGAVPREYIPAVEAGYRAAVVGAKYGFPCVDMSCTLIDGKYHEVDSSAEAFKLAGIECCRDAQVKAGIACYSSRS